MNKYKVSRYEYYEPRLSIYGKAKAEWGKLAAWVVDNELQCNNIRWMIQIPRLFWLHKKTKKSGEFPRIARKHL